MLDNEAFQRDNVEESYKALGINREDGRIPGLGVDIRLKLHQVVALKWMRDQENGLAQGGLLADDCGLGKV
jgi:SNF2 family DNA or RNA helicase